MIELYLSQLWIQHLTNIVPIIIINEQPNINNKVIMSNHLNHKRQTSELGDNKRIQAVQKQQPKHNNLLQLKDQLVKMKQFLNQEMPVLSKLVPSNSRQQTQGQPLNSVQQKSMSHEQLIQIVHKNRRLTEQNQKLSQMLIKQRSLKKRLNNSLHKQERMLTNLYETTHRKLQNHQAVRNQFSRKPSNNKSLSIKPKQVHTNDSGSHSVKKFIKLPKSQSLEKVNIWHGRSQSRQNLQKFISDTSINTVQHDWARNSRRVTCQYSSSEQQTILTLKQLNFLELKMQDLIRQCQKTENRSKKLQMRKQLQKIAVKINDLKSTLNINSS